jgi:hypothetical protein
MATSAMTTTVRRVATQAEAVKITATAKEETTEIAKTDSTTMEIGISEVVVAVIIMIKSDARAKACRLYHLRVSSKSKT